VTQRGTPLTALLRAYRLGHAHFSDWLLTELAEHTGDAKMIIATTLSLSRILAGYIDQTSEEIVAAYTQERENWLRLRNASRTARIRDLLSGERVSVSTTEAALGYRLRQYHVGLVCWAADATATADSATWLEHTISRVAGNIAGSGEPVFLPRDESCAWAWLPLGIRDRFDAAEAAAGVDSDLHFAFGDAARGVAGFRLTHQQALAAQAVALAAGSPPRVVTFGEVAPVAMMLGSAELLRAWVLATLAGLATNDEHHARLRDTLLVFLQSGGVTRRRPSSWSCIRTRCSTGSARPRRVWASRPVRTATTSHSRCASATGSARPYCSPALHRPPPTAVTIHGRVCTDRNQWVGTRTASGNRRLTRSWRASSGDSSHSGGLPALAAASWSSHCWVCGSMTGVNAA
jgi:GGDEF-like domain